MTESQPERGSRGTPMPQEPTPPTGGEPLQDHAPPEDVPTEELLGGDGGTSQGQQGDGGQGGRQTPEKDVEDWATGDEPMTGPQRSYLETLAREAGRDVPDNLTKAQASQLIDQLQDRTGRGS